MSEIDWEFGVDTNNSHCQQWISLEKLYQAFKARMAAEAQREDDDFTLGEACDLSKEGGCESCQ